MAQWANHLLCKHELTFPEVTEVLLVAHTFGTHLEYPSTPSVRWEAKSEDAPGAPVPASLAYAAAVRPVSNNQKGRTDTQIFTLTFRGVNVLCPGSPQCTQTHTDKN